MQGPSHAAPSEARRSRDHPANCIDLRCALAAAKLCCSSTSRLASESVLRVPDPAKIEGISHAFVVWRALRSPPPRWTRPPQSQPCAASPNWRLCRRRRGCPRPAAVRASSVKAAACESTRTSSFPMEGARRTARQRASVACSARSPVHRSTVEKETQSVSPYQCKCTRFNRPTTDQGLLTCGSEHRAMVRASTQIHRSARGGTRCPAALR